MVHAARLENTWAEHMMYYHKPDSDDSALMLRARTERNTHSIVTAEKSFFTSMMTISHSKHIEWRGLQNTCVRHRTVEQSREWHMQPK